MSDILIKPFREGRSTTYLLQALNIKPHDYKLKQASLNAYDQPQINFDAFEKDIIEGVNVLMAAGKNDIVADFTNRWKFLSNELADYKQKRAIQEVEYNNLKLELGTPVTESSQFNQKIEEHKKNSDALKIKLKELENSYQGLVKEISSAKARLGRVTPSLRPE